MALSDFTEVPTVDAFQFLDEAEKGIYDYAFGYGYALTRSEEQGQAGGSTLGGSSTEEREAEGLKKQTTEVEAA